MKCISTLTLLFVVFVMDCRTQTKNTENTLKLAAGAVGEKATISDAEWLMGSWHGTGLGGVSEETWSKPNAGAMIGTYRLIKDGKPVFYEMMWLLEQEGTIILRLKHFSADLVGWEEKDKTVDFKFVKRDSTRLYFSGLTFERAGSDGLNIFLVLRQRDGSLKEEAFAMKRTAK